MKLRTALVLLVSAALSPHLWPTTDEDLGYRIPPAPLADLIDAPPTPLVSLSPDRTAMLLMERPNLPSLDELAQPELRLAGLRIRPRTNGPSRTSYLTGLVLQRVSDGKRTRLRGLPQDARLGFPAWSPDGKHLAFTVTGDDGIQAWVADTGGGRARRLGEHRLNAAATGGLVWLPDSNGLMLNVVPPERGQAPVEPAVPTAPVVQENLGRKAPARTYQDLLKNPHDEELFEHYLDAQLVRVGLDGTSMPLGDRSLIWDFDPSPDGRFLLVEALHRPFSYLVPAFRFPRRIEVWDRQGKLVHRVADLPLQDDVPTAFGSVPTGPRSVTWRADAPATLVWAEAQDGGDAAREADLRDRVFALEPPFTGEPRVLAALSLRYGGITWGHERLALATEWWWKTRRARTWILNPDEPGSEPELLFDLSWEDRYNDPGNPVTVPNAAGRPVLLTTAKGDRVFLIGDGASPEGDRPFLDELDLKTRATRRLFRSEAPYYERPVILLDGRGRSLITRREARDEPPNYFIRDTRDGALRVLTAFPHPTPQLLGTRKELIRYDRGDGVTLTATLYTPPGYEQDQGPLPTLVWAYPQEFKSADAASQVTDSPFRFDRVGWWSSLLFLTRGYAVLDDPALPIVGEGQNEPNDTYVEQLVLGARAAVEEVTRRGVADPERVAIGGHSYGAFMTANLLAHSDLFRAGIARSGAYNRTLTPFGFQAEERTLWEASNIYFTMSPFMHADEVDEPILLIHGEADSNSGTYPMQSERFYNALKGLGATARLVMLPHESHGYRARESVLHMLWEMDRWLERYVKNAPPRRTEPAASGPVRKLAPPAGRPR